MTSALGACHGVRGLHRCVGVLLAALLLAGPFAGAGRAQAGPAIRVEGNQRIDADTIRTYFHTGKRGTLDAATLDAALKALYATGMFEDVRMRRAGDALVVTVVENPLIQRLAFEGNRKIKDKELQKEVESRAGGPLWRPVVQQDVAHIVEAYHRRGYFDVKVDPKVIKAQDRQVGL